MKLTNWLYGYCTDFMINLANLTGYSYYEVNLVLFGFVYPLLLLGLLIGFVVQLRRKTIAVKL